MNRKIRMHIYIPVLSARSFIETTSEPDPASLIAKAPICSPLRSWEENVIVKPSSY